jgi:hypothetical protein
LLFSLSLLAAVRGGTTFQGAFHGVVFGASTVCGSGLSYCRVAAFCAIARSALSDFFITISHCPWRDFISLSNSDKETKQRKRLATANS